MAELEDAIGASTIRKERRVSINAKISKELRDRINNSFEGSDMNLSRKIEILLNVGVKRIDVLKDLPSLK